jgi:hypothetical protein
MNLKIQTLIFFAFLSLFISQIESQVSTIIPLTTTPSAIDVQISPISIVKPSDCIFPTQYYDISRLACINCPVNSSVTENREILKFYKIIQLIFNQS